jgi:hypothetical protein
MADDRTYIKVHDGMPDHPKIEPLSDAAFRLLMGVWCWCSRHLTDGRVPAAIWEKRGTPKTRGELLAAGLATPAEDGVLMHDYLEHQRSAAKVAERKEAKSAGGHLGNHRRWHEDRGVVAADCSYCAPPNGSGPPPGRRSTDRIPTENRSDVRSEDRSDTRRKRIAEVEVEVKTETRQGTSESSQRALVDAREDHAHSEAGELAAHFAELMPLTNHGKALDVIARALEAGYEPALIRNGLTQLADTGRVCTPDTLRIAMTGAADNWRPAAQPQSKAEGWLTLDVPAGLQAMHDRLNPPPELRALPGGAA